jgi:3'-phosphoadenosine 5'-phosphosulfate sulfotransferase (PAPS reductase)/FAD synthetase
MGEKMLVKEEETLRLIERVADEWPRRTFYCFFSGGRDSVVATHLVHRVVPERAEAVFIDTTIGSQQTMDYVKSTCEMFGWKLNIIRPEKTYEELVARWGFPHWYRYRWCLHHLKLKPILRFMKGKRGIEVTGVRKDESVRRLIALQCTRELERLRNGRMIFAPLLRWNEEDVRGYHERYRIPQNPLWKILHFSGDCFCLAWPSAPKLERIRAHLPEIYRRLAHLEQEVLRSKGYTIVHGLATKDLERQQLISAYFCPCGPSHD